MIRPHSLVLTLMLSLQSGFALAQESPSNFRITDIQSSGSGCEPGTVGTNISEDQEAFTVSFSTFVAELAPEVPRSERRKNCRISFGIEHDPGWEFAVMGVTQRGAIYLEEGVFARQSLRYGPPLRQQSIVSLQRGPLDQDYVQSHRIALANLRWSGCHRFPKTERAYDMQTSVELFARKPDARGLLTVDTIDGEVKQLYDLVWRRCNARSHRVIASCSLQLADEAGSQIFAKAKAATSFHAIEKARRNLERRCVEASGSLDACDMAKARCELGALRI